MVARIAMKVTKTKKVNENCFFEDIFMVLELLLLFFRLSKDDYHQP